jgi:two-component sensor histidine kinase
MDSIIAKSYSLALLLSILEICTNAFAQQSLLNPAVFWPLVVLNLASVLLLAIGNWFIEVSNRWYVIHACVVAFSLLLWPMAPMDPAHLPAGFTPFIWWTLGWGALSAGLGLNRILGALYMVLIPAWFATEQVMPAGGNATLGVAFQNGVYTFLISAVLVSMVGLLRWQAVQQDLAAETAAKAQAASAAENGVAGEHLKLGSMVHNQILTALDAAVAARTSQERAGAAKLAESAIDRLRSYEAESVAKDVSITASAFFSSLSDLIQKQQMDWAISASAEGAMQIPNEVISAMTEATLQAMENSELHAGGPSVKRKVNLRSSKGEVKIAVIDDGVGFRPSRISKNRIGLRVLIFKRMTQVGGQAHVNAKPGEGTTVVLEWSGDE